MKKNKKKRWLKFRHRIARNILFALLAPVCRIKYGIKIRKFKEQEKRPYLILMNHQTAFDQFFVGLAFKGPVYYMATEDLFSNGIVSSIIRYLVAPIPIKKQTVDAKAVINCIRVAKEGGTIAIAPEGNRTYSGKTEYINPAIAPLARKLGLPIALYRIEGGYGVQPRWSDVVRRGKMQGYVSRVIKPEEYEALTDDELYGIIKDGLYVDEAVVDGLYTHKKSAEYLERAIYTCPFCGLSNLKSHGDIIECKKCGRRVRYTSTKELVGVDFEFPFRFVKEWYDYQNKLVGGLDTTAFTEEPLYTDEVKLSLVIPYKKKKKIAKRATASLYGDRITISFKNRTVECPHVTTPTVTVLGKNKLNIYHDGNIYQLKGDKRFSALKYVNVYYRARDIAKGEQNGLSSFLGI